MAAAQGWPFLVARGRQSGYTVRLAPDFLIKTREYGLLEEIAGTGGQVANVKGLAVVWAEHTVTGSDIDAAEAPRDEHSRPLHLMYGFVSPHGTIDQPSEVDLSRSRELALETFRRFLADEREFTLEPSGPFPLASSIAPLAVRPPVVTRRVVPFALAGAAAVAAVLVAIMSFGGENPPPPPLPCTTPTPVVTIAPSAAQMCPTPVPSRRNP
ncbi:hypothetical protein LWC34_47400 [Kibdelosporangium philippinense]|uniref:Uncharacterized protein n=1 Tax=Kibdelosporangium philippinense TaxID=211113 RepID=A0ABS8ZRU4_9PSEU|nr:hypothetical protein [Kibdelosporangium philippinense]MCE7010382.1 hypothetical protein [Kibdelosporangium philippinense]